MLSRALLVALVVANPFRINRESALLRTAGLALTTLVGLSNGWSAVLLVLDLVAGGLSSPAELLTAGGAIWLTNVLVFALWYWELDRGGPIARFRADHPEPDFLFPQMTAPQAAQRNWSPSFIDYLFVSFTNATAFSPTDTMPLTQWAKLLMMAQSAASLLTLVLVGARAVNILN